MVKSDKSDRFTNLPRSLALNLPEDGGDAMGDSQWTETRQVLTSQFSQRTARFLLPRSGVLSADSFVTYKIVGSQDNMFLPVATGALSCIESATLSVGGTVIAQTRALNQRYTMTTNFRTQRGKALQQSIRTGVTDCIAVATNGVTQVPVAVPASSGKWGIDISNEFISSADGDNASINPAYKIRNIASKTPEWRIYLSDLFPGMQFFHLPLQLMEQVTLQISWAPDTQNGQRVLVDPNVAIGGIWSTGNNIDQASCIFHCTLLHWDDPIDGRKTTMERLEDELEAGLTLVYTDDAHIRVEQAAQQQGSGAGGSSRTSALLGLDGETVRTVMIATPNAPNFAQGSTPANRNTNFLMGPYHSEGSRLAQEMQLTINSKPVFPIAINRPSEQYAELSQIFPVPAAINSARFTHLGQVIATTGAGNDALSRLTSLTFNGIQQNGSFQGTSNYYGVNLSSTYSNSIGAGTRINAHNPVVLDLEMQGAAGVAALRQKIVLVWAVLERVMQIRGQKVMVTGS